MSDIERKLIAGYRLDAIIGRGGMGVVYRATQLDLGRTVALKVIAGELLEDEVTRRRFLQESRLAASIEHPHVIPIHAAGEEDCVPYIVMRYVPGADARTLVRSEGPLAPERAATIVAQVADALDAAHAAGLVHRDVKPGNVLLAAGDHAYLSDFGLSRHVESVSGSSRAGRWVGTLDYVAPEQIRGDLVDARSDVYALGCVLFYLLTGSVPFPRDGDEARLWAHLTEPPPSPGGPFDAVIARALAKAPDDRYPSAGDLGRAALAAAAGQRVRRRERTVATGDAAAMEVPTRPSAARPRRRRGGVAGLLALAAVAAGAGTVLALEDDPEPRPRDRGVAARDASPRPATSAPRVVSRAPVGRRPNTLVRAGGRVWVGAFGSSTLDAVDPDTGRRVRDLRPDVGGGTADIASSRGRLWVATRGRQIVALDARTGARVGSPLPLPLEPVEVVARRGDLVAGVESDDSGAFVGQLLRFDTDTGALEASQQVMHGMAGALYARGSLWTLHGDPNYIVRRNPVTLRARQRIKLPGATVGALAYGSGSLWATIPDQDMLVRYSLRTRHRADVEVGARPVGLAVRDGRVWVAASGASTVEQVRAAGLQPSGEPIRTPLNPYALIIGPDGIWITCVGQNVVAHVDVRS